MATIESKIRTIVTDQAYGRDAIDAPALKLDTKLMSDLGLDSMDMVEIAMAIEEDFNIEIPDEDTEKFVTLGDLVEYVSNKQS